MKIALILSTLISLSAFANHELAGEIKDKGKKFQKLFSADEVIVMNTLHKIYEDYELKPDEKYLLININQHPGLRCKAAVSLPNDIYVDVHLTEQNERTLIAPLPVSKEMAVLFTVCHKVSYLGTESHKPPAFHQAIDGTISSMIISMDKISLPTESKISPNRSGNGGYKIQYLDLGK